MADDAIESYRIVKARDGVQVALLPERGDEEFTVNGLAQYAASQADRGNMKYAARARAALADMQLYG